ncbi:MAG: DUF6364 family protein [Planctomycetota bacterium]
MKEINLHIEDDTIKEAKHIAAENDMSLSQWVSELIKSKVYYSKSSKRAIERLDRGFHLSGALDRETIYSEDLNHGQDYDGIRVKNPLK